MKEGVAMTTLTAHSHTTPHVILGTLTLTKHI